MSTYKFSVDTPPIPSTDQFRLDSVLASFAPETNDVVDSMVGVSRNYQKDLRDEIKRSLTREQQIQVKNIKVAKMTKALTKRMAQASPSSTMVASVGSEVNELLMVTTTTNTRLKAVLERLETVDFDPARFPKLAQLLRKPNGHQLTTQAPQLQRQSSTSSTTQPLTQQSTQMSAQPSTHSSLSDASLQPVDHPELLVRPPQSPSEQSPSTSAPSSLREPSLQPESSSQSPQPTDLVESNSSESRSLESSKSSESISSQSQPSKSQSPVHRRESSIDPLEPIRSSSDSIDPLEPTTTTSSLLSSTTNRTPRKPFIKVESQEPMSPQEFEEFMAQSITQYRRKKTSRSFSSPRARGANHNPINLLYSSLMSHPKYVDPIPKLSNPNPFSSVISIKSSPTAMQTFQTSHYKKLRINGDPITTATFIKAQARKNDQRPQCAPCECSKATPAQKALEMLTTESITSSIDTPCTPPQSPLRGESSPRSSPTKRGSDDDIWKTVDSEGLDLSPPRHAAASAPRTPLLSDADVSFEKDVSPTPKHRPSHHTLKPKRSILKSSISGQAVPIKKNKLDAAKYSAPSALSEINSAYDGKNNLSVTSFSANGILVPVATGEFFKRGSPPDNDDNRSILSISNLKAHLEDY